MSMAEFVNWPLLSENLGYLLVGRFPEEAPGGLLLTLLLSVVSMLLALPLGALLALLCWFSPAWLRRVILLLGDLVRGIPLLLLIFWLYFFLPMLLGQGTPDLLSVVTALGLFSGVSVMHILYGALTALPRGQHEAARAAGFSELQSLRWVLLPQLLPMTIPAFVNLLVALIKDTSLAYIVSVPELTLLTNQVNNRTMVYPLQLFALAGLLYFLLCTLLSTLAWNLERRQRVRSGFSLYAEHSA